MTKLRFIILLIISASCLGEVRPNIEASEAKCSNNNLFSHYLTAFEVQTLPFKMDRKDVLRLGNLDNSFPEIKDSLKLFIPEELRNSHPNSTFRSLYLLPNKNDITTVLILQNLVNKYGAKVIKTHIVTYNTDGKILSFQELAGVNIDVWETLILINSEYVIKRRNYQFKINKDIENIKFYHSIETIFTYEIKLDGSIDETKKLIREGYFKRDWTGYYFVKPLTKT